MPPFYDSVTETRWCTGELPVDVTETRLRRPHTYTYSRRDDSYCQDALGFVESTGNKRHARCPDHSRANTYTNTLREENLVVCFAQARHH